MRRKRFNNEKKFTLLRNSFIASFILVCIFIGTGYSLLTTKIEIEGKATMLSDEQKEENTELSNSTANIEFDTIWANNVMFRMIIKNQDEDIRNWNFSFNISDIPSNVVIYGLGDNLSITTSGNTIKVKETGNDWVSDWNINTEKTIQFQMEFQTGITKFSISDLIFNGKKINKFTSNTNSVIIDKSFNKITFELTDKQSIKNETENNISNNISNQNTIKNNTVNNIENKAQDAENEMNNENKNVVIEDKTNSVNEKSTKSAVNNVLNDISNNIIDNTNKTRENEINQDKINTNNIINIETE